MRRSSRKPGARSGRAPQGRSFAVFGGCAQPPCRVTAARRNFTVPFSPPSPARRQFVMSSRFSLLAILLLALGSPAFAAKPAPLRVLFVGNSLTYTNDLPAMVARIAALDHRRLETRTVAQPNYSLADHLQSPAFRTLLQERWDFVVLQQGPSSLPDSRAQLVHDTKTIAALVHERSRAKIALLMVWPPRARAHSWDRVIGSYADAASAVDGLLIPAGLYLRQALRNDPTLPLLGADGFHPATAGTYLAALATYHAITSRLPAECDDPSVARKIAGDSLPLSHSALKVLVSTIRD